MGARKRNVAEERKAAIKKVAIAKLNDCPTSPRKMRLMATPRKMPSMDGFGLEVAGYLEAR